MKQAIIIVVIVVIFSFVLFAFTSSNTSNSSPTTSSSDDTTTSPKTTSSQVTRTANTDDNFETSSSSSSSKIITDSSSSSGKRGIIALYLTHVGFHGVALVKSNIHGWVQNFVLPQKNLDLTIFYDKTNVTEEVLVSKIGLQPVPDITKLLEENLTSSSTNPDELQPRLQQKRTKKSNNDLVIKDAIRRHTVLKEMMISSSNNNGDQDGKKSSKNTPSTTDLESSGLRWFLFCSPASSTKNCVLISLIGVETKWPKYLQNEEKRKELLARKDWLRCGCPPYCPVRRNPPEYVQGTRWYTYDIFFEANRWIKKYYDYWVKLDVDITIFRPLTKVNLIDEMESKKKVFLHTGYTYNGGGCSNNLHKSIVSWSKEQNIDPVSKEEKWWKQDDNVYYSNFVVTSVAFSTSPKPLELARHLNDDVEDGFFKYRWTDQSLFHKVFGVFLGPKEEDFLLDYSWMRWSKKGFKKNALFYHSKKGKTRSELSKTTKL